MQHPWDDWIPGVLNKAQVETLCAQGYITGVDESWKAIDLSSIDLSLSDSAFEMKEGSVKPTGQFDYDHLLRDSKLAEKLKQLPDGTFLLKAKATYVFKLRERLSRLVDSSIHGQATAKSSVGRVDVLARLIVDGMDSYESFEPDRLKGASGNMYLEITPITFSVLVKPGMPLTQLRLFYGRPHDVEVRSRELFKTVLEGPGARDGSLAIDLENEVWGGLKVAAFCANGEASTNQAVPLWVEQGKKSDPCKYWRFQESIAGRLKIEKEQFYILRSKEKIAVPPGIAVYCRASDETIGEMRIHYAGFVHPYFGLRRNDGTRGTPLIFEVRGHQVNVNLADGEKMANLIFYRMSLDAAEPDPADDDYGSQTLKLSKFFHEWPNKLKRNDYGAVEAT
ncbi:MAG: 2'-deoxycytidine 5'-triphosphate deaminase [Candidatus Sulfotelmatobacter sp.]